MNSTIERILVSEEEINNITKRLGEQISKEYQDKNPLFIGLLKGCAPFMMDLMKNISIYCTMDFIYASSYHGETRPTTSDVQIEGKLSDVRGRDVIIVDDILDTGRTLLKVKNLLLSKGAKSVKLCVLLDKKEGRLVDIEAEYVGTLLENAFVVGYGLDYQEKYRNLPFIGVLKESVYK